MQARKKIRIKPKHFLFFRKLRVALLTGIYIGLLIYCYIMYLTPLYENLGFHDYSINNSVVTQIVAIVIVILVALLLPFEIKRYSDYASTFIFYLLYVPTMVYVPMQGSKVNADLSFILILTLSFLTILLIPRLSKRRNTSSYHTRIPGGFYPVFFSLYVIFTLYILYVFRGHIELVSVSDVFVHRLAAGRVGEGTYAGYAIGFLAGCFNPFLVAVGLIEKRKLFLALGIAGQFLIYGIAAHKFVLAGTLAMVVFYYIVINRKSFNPLNFAYVITTGIAVPTGFIVVMGTDIAYERPLNEIVSLIIMRTYGIQAVATGWYYEYFSQNPLTYYSHINIVSLLVEYPYGSNSIGQQVGGNVAGNFDFNVTTNFWATDGFAAAGKLGVIIIGFVVGLLLLLVNIICPQEKMKMMCTGTSISLMMLISSPLTTVLLTGGGIMLFLFLLFWEPQYNSKIINRRGISGQYSDYNNNGYC